MRRQRISAVLCGLVLALGAAAVAPASAQQASMKGTFALNRQASDNVHQAIERAVARLNFVTRPIARGRLRKTNVPYERVVIDFNTSQVRVTRDNLPAIVTPANGTPTPWTREDGERFDVSTEWENGRLEQTFRAEDGQRVNVFTISEDGRTLTMDVTITSPRLENPLRYKLVFDRA
ncbi:MAG TPA: hypothetical protein VFX98_14330 [Longimicrobiaceae bacterium]|nr:hypothetical protein [Longimicrobiaceae bacterium]